MIDINKVYNIDGTENTDIKAPYILGRWNEIEALGLDDWNVLADNEGNQVIDNDINPSDSLILNIIQNANNANIDYKDISVFAVVIVHDMNDWENAEINDINEIGWAVIAK